MSVTRILHPELFFGLVAPVGVNLDMIIEVLVTELNLQKYSTSILHVTEIMKDVPSNIQIKEEPYLERIKTRIAYADEICARIEREDALAAITISAIQSSREKFNRERAAKESRELILEDSQSRSYSTLSSYASLSVPKKSRYFDRSMARYFFKFLPIARPQNGKYCCGRKSRNLTLAASMTVRQSVKLSN
jgi:hypothetical protein